MHASGDPDLEELWLPSALIEWSPKKNRRSCKDTQSDSSEEDADEVAARAQAERVRRRRVRTRGRRGLRRRSLAPEDDVDERSTTVQAALRSGGAGDRSSSVVPRLPPRTPPYRFDFTLPGAPMEVPSEEWRCAEGVDAIDAAMRRQARDSMLSTPMLEPVALSHNESGAVRVLGDPDDPSTLVVRRVLHRLLQPSAPALRPLPSASVTSPRRGGHAIGAATASKTRSPTVGVALPSFGKVVYG